MKSITLIRYNSIFFILLVLFILFAIPNKSFAYQYDSYNKVYKLQQNDGIGGVGDAKLYFSGYNFYYENWEYDDWYSEMYISASGTQSITSDGMIYHLYNNGDWVNYNRIYNKNTDPVYVDVSGVSSIQLFGTNNGSFTFTNSPPIKQTSTANINPGKLQLSFASNTFNFSNIQLDGTAKTITSTIPTITVKDATGSLGGWNVNVSATPFIEATPSGGFKSGTTAKTLSSSTFTIKPSSVAALDNASLTGVTVPTINQNLLGGDVTIASASKGNGMGKYQVNFASDALNLQIPQTVAYVDTINYPSTGTPYQSIITWKIVVAP